MKASVIIHVYFVFSNYKLKASQMNAMERNSDQDLKRVKSITMPYAAELQPLVSALVFKYFLTILQIRMLCAAHTIPAIGAGVLSV